MHQGERRAMRAPRVPIAAILSGFLILAACSEDESPVRLGLIAGISGANADGGQAARNGALLAVEEINRTGGIKGRPIELVIRDDGYSPEKAAEAAREFINKQVTAIVGPFTSATSKAVRSVTEPAEMLVFSPTAMSDDFTGLDDHFFRLAPISRESARNYAVFFTKQRGVRRVALIADETNLPLTGPYAEAFTSEFSALGGETVLSIWGNFRAFVGFDDLIRQLHDSNADALFLLTNAVDATRVIHQVRKVDDRIKIFAIAWAGTQQLIELGGKAVEGVEIGRNIDPFNTDENYLRFVESFKRRFNSKPSFSSVATYETVQVLRKALQNRKDGKSVKQAILANRPYQGLQEPLIMDDYGDSRRRSYFVVVKDAKYAPAP